VVELGTGGVSSGAANIGTWSDDGGLSIIKNGISHSRPGSESYGKKTTYVLTSVLEEPFLRLRSGSRGDLDDDVLYEGYVKELADLIALEIGVQFEIRPVLDGKYGSRDGSRKGGWNGMIGELIRHEADLAIGPLTISSTREAVVDFSTPFMSAEVSILVQDTSSAVRDTSGLFSFLTPLSREVWVCVACAYVGVSIVIFIVSRFSPDEWVIEDGANGGSRIRNQFSVGNSFWFALSSLAQQSNELAPRSAAGRVVSGTWWFFTVIVIAAYTANLAAFRTSHNIEPLISSADQLARQTEIEYGTVLGGTTMDFFSKSTIPTYNRMWEFMVARRGHVFVNSTSEGVHRVRSTPGGRYAFLVESPIAEYAETRLPCDTITATTRAGLNRDLNSGGGYGVATSKGSDIKEDVNKAILSLRETGKLARLKAKWWYEDSQCRAPSSLLGNSGRHNQGSELTLANLSGLFFVLVLGLILAMVLALCEFCHNSRQESKRGKIPFSDSIKTKARQAIQGGVESDGLRFYGGDSSAL